MIIMAVDNHCDRLDDFALELKKAYPDDTVVKFSDPFYAGQYINNHKPELVFVDLELCPFDGFQFAELAAKLCAGIQTVVLTDDAEESFYIMEEGYDHVSGSLARPISLEKLKKRQFWEEAVHDDISS